MPDMDLKSFYVYTDLDWKSNAIPALRNCIQSLLLEGMNRPNELGNLLKGDYPQANAAFPHTVISDADKIGDKFVTAATVKIGRKRFDIIDMNKCEVDIDVLKELIAFIIKNNVRFDLDYKDANENSILVNGEVTPMQIITFDDINEAAKKRRRKK